jgi:hypothetical protein
MSLFAHDPRRPTSAAPARHRGRLLRQRRRDRGGRDPALLPAPTRALREATAISSRTILAKVETHNHPTAISPFPGAATGSGGEIRDEGATGRGSASPRPGSAASAVSEPAHPRLRPQALGDRLRQARSGSTSALDIMIEGPIGAAAFNNEFGRPEPGRLFPHLLPGDRSSERPGDARLPQADHDRRRPRQHRPPRTHFKNQVARPGEPADRARRSRHADRPRRRRGVIDGDRFRTPPTSTSPRCSVAIRRSSGAAQEVIDRCSQQGAMRQSDTRRSTTSVPAASPTRCPRSSPTMPSSAVRIRPARDSQRGARHEPPRDLEQRGAGTLCARHRPGQARAVRVRCASASAARSPCSAWRPPTTILRLDVVRRTTSFGRRGRRADRRCPSKSCSARHAAHASRCVKRKPRPRCRPFDFVALDPI